jgi:hypothetical protein
MVNNRDYGDETDFQDEDEEEPDAGVREPSKPKVPPFFDGIVLPKDEIKNLSEEDDLVYST